MFNDLTFVIGMGGAIGGSCAGFITPSIMYIKTFTAEFMAAFKESKLKGLCWFALPALCLLFGVMGLVAGSAATIINEFYLH